MTSETTLRLHEPTFGEDEIAAAVAVLRSTNVTSGTRVREFEDLFGPNAVMCNSGSSANLLAVAAVTNPKVTYTPLVPGDEVIVPALSWSTTVWPLVQHGLVPVIVDIDPETLCIDPILVEAAIGPRTRGVVAVDVYGNPCDTLALRCIADDNGLVFIEDGCEALGAKRSDDTEPDFLTYSFYFSHHITTLEGGMVVARDEEDAELMRVLRAHGWTRDMRKPFRPLHSTRQYEHIDPRFLFVNAGYNLRASELAAAIGLVQHAKLTDFVLTRKLVASCLMYIFKNYPQFRLQKEQWSDASSWFGFPVVVADDAGFTAQALRKTFEAAGIETRPIICGNIARQPGMQLFPHRVHGTLEHSNRVMDNGFAIGCHQAVTATNVNIVASVLDDFMHDHGHNG